MTLSKNERLEGYRDQIIDNIETLQLSLSELERVGLHDDDSVIYNELSVLATAAAEIREVTELGMVVSQAQVIEKQIDLWLETHSLDSKGLPWPIIR